MKNIGSLFCLLVFLAGFGATAWAQQATPQSAPAAVKAAEPAKPVVEQTAPAVTAPVAPAPLATQIEKTIQTIVDKTAAIAQPPATDEPVEPIADTFVLDVLDALNQAGSFLKQNAEKLGSFSAATTDFGAWLGVQGRDSRRIALWGSLGGDFLMIVVPPFLVGAALFFFLMPLRKKLKLKRKTLPEKVWLLFGLFFLRLIPVLAFFGAALALLEQNETQRLQRFVVSNIIYALSLAYAVRQVLRGLLSPSTDYLRILPLSTPQAVSISRWLSAFSFLVIGGYFALDIASALRVPSSVVLISKSVFAVGLTVLAIAAIFRLRAPIASMLRGSIDKNSSGFIDVIRLGLARRWHSLAIAYLMISLAVILMGVENNIVLVLRGTILSIIALIAARLAYLAAERWQTPRPGETPLVHRRVIFFLMRPFLWIAVLVGIAASWGLDVGRLAATPRGARVWGAVVSVGLTLFVLTVLYEVIHRLIDRHLSRIDKDDRTPLASARAQTLLPMLRTSALIFLSTIGIFVCLSAIGVDIGPLLAGAGIVGVAIGFGSQTLVKDFLTGLFIVAENTIAVGDIVKIDDFSGVVETLSLRTIRLRAFDGSLHILPFGEVSKITNMTRGFAYAVIDIGVAYDSDLDRVLAVLREIGGEIQSDPAFKRLIAAPIEVLGVEAFEASAITLRARIRTRPGKQWDIKREFLLRMKRRFDKEGIEIPFQTVVHIEKKAE